MPEFVAVLKTGHHDLDDDVPRTTFASDHFATEAGAQAAADKFGPLLGVDARVEARDPDPDHD